jgi:hypothetical protein
MLDDTIAEALSVWDRARENDQADQALAYELIEWYHCLLAETLQQRTAARSCGAPKDGC